MTDKNTTAPDGPWFGWWLRPLLIALTVITAPFRWLHRQLRR